MMWKLQKINQLLEETGNILPCVVVARTVTSHDQEQIVTLSTKNRLWSENHASLLSWQ